jgi:uncharacterized protein YbaR (Trm112 family)
VFIELTDHLRCPAEHPESFLVLLPDAMEGRRVLRGRLGCPVCHASYPIVDGVAELGDAEPGAWSGVDPEAPAGPDADGVRAFLGIEGPGGYVGLVGDAARFASGLAALLPGVQLVLINPPAGTAFPAGTSVLRAARMPLKARSLRGVVVGRPFAERPIWVADAIGTVLPGLAAAGSGPVPVSPGFELLGSAAGWWVGRTTT